MKRLAVLIVALAAPSVAWAEPGIPVPGSCEGVCSADGWCWVNPLPQGSTLTAVWGSGPNDVYAATSGGALLHSDGTSWKVAFSDSALQFRALWGSGPQDVWAVGGKGRAAAILHYDGTRWEPTLLDKLPPLRAVWGTGPTEVFAVGEERSFATWDGKKWTARPGKSSFDYLSLWGTGPKDLWAGLQGSVAHFNGKDWQVVRPLKSGEFTYSSIWGAGAKDVFALASPGQSGFAAAARFDGKRWTPIQTKGWWRTAWASGAGPVFVASLNRVARLEAQTLAPIDEATLSHQVFALWGSGPEDVWAVGAQGGISRFDGKSWKRVNESALSQDLTVVRSLDRAGVIRGSDFALSSVEGQLRRVAADECTYLQVDDYCMRSRERLTFPHGVVHDFREWIQAVDGGLDARREPWIVAVAHQAVFRHPAPPLTADEEARQRLPSAPEIEGGFRRDGAPNANRAMWAASRDDVFLGGVWGEVGRWRDGKWEGATIGGAEYTAMWGSGPEDVYAVTDSYAVHYDGKSWKKLDCSYGAKVAIGGSGPDEVFVAGPKGALWRLTPTSCTPVDSGTDADLLGIWARGPGDLFAVGRGGTILHYGGKACR